MSWDVPHNKFCATILLANVGRFAYVNVKLHFSSSCLDRYELITIEFPYESYQNGDFSHYLLVLITVELLTSHNVFYMCVCEQHVAAQGTRVVLYTKSVFARNLVET